MDCYANEGSLYLISSRARWVKGERYDLIRTYSRWELEETPFREDIGLFWASHPFLHEQCDRIPVPQAEMMDPGLVACATFFEEHADGEAWLWRIIDESDEAKLYQEIRQFYRQENLPYSVHAVAVSCSSELFKMLRLKASPWGKQEHFRARYRKE